MGQRVGVVLAGGRGERFGAPKGSVEIEGRTLAERAAAVLWPICGSVLISTAPGAANPAPAYPALADPEPGGLGPLAGIDAAFAATSDADLLVLACDYPFVEESLLRRLVALAGDDDELVFPTDFAGRDHPLVALWMRAAAPAVRRAVASRALKVRALLADLAVRRLEPSEFRGIDLDRALRNVNRPVELPRTGGSEL